MNELSERELRRRFAAQDDAAFTPRATFAELVGEPLPIARRRRGVRRPLIAGLGIAALLGLAVAAVALRRPAASQPVATAVTTPVVATTNPTATTTTTASAPDAASAVAVRVLAAANDDGDNATAATCHAMSSAEREAARADFGATGLPLYLCSLTLAGTQVPFNVQLLANGCFVAHPSTKAKPAVIYGCGVAPAPPVQGMAALGQEIAAGVDVSSEPVERATLTAGGVRLLLASYRVADGVTCAVVATVTAADPKAAEEPPSCGDGRGYPTADLRIVPVRAGGERVTVLAGLVDPEVTSIRIGDRDIAIEGSPIPGSSRRPVLLDLAGARQAEALAGTTVVARIGGPGSFRQVAAPAPAPDGRTLAHLVGVVGGAGLMVDPLEWHTGADAVATCRQLGETDCEVDYQIVNPDGRRATTPLAPDAAVTLVDWAHCCERTRAGTLQGLQQALRATPDDPVRATYRVTSPFWVTVQGGRVTRIEEQYLP